MKDNLKKLKDSIIIIPIISGLLTTLIQDFFKENFNLSILPTSIIVVTLTIIIYILYNLGKYGCKNSNALGIHQIEEIICKKKYNNKSLFYIDGEEYNQFEVVKQNKQNKRILLWHKIFNTFPVIYYNVTAKNFLNWIDFIYLITLRELESTIGAKIIISLHVDEQLMNEGLFREDKRNIYQNQKKEAKNIIKKILPNAKVVDEFEYYINAKRSSEVFPEQLISIIVSDINYFVKKLSESEINYKQFIRYESNVLSILPILILSKKYSHLFVLDYKSSFDVWNLNPYPDIKKARNIFFIKCNKIENKNGERIPSWSVDDGINFTDSEDVIEEKLQKLDDSLLSVMCEIFLDNNANGKSQKEQLKIWFIKTKHNYHL